MLEKTELVLVPFFMLEKTELVLQKIFKVLVDSLFSAKMYCQDMFLHSLD